MARLGAPVAEAGRADQAQLARDRYEQRAARVAFAGVGAALRVAGADHRARVEVAVVLDLVEAARVRRGAYGSDVIGTWA
jgi:hypothetical protein